jgi:transmembrane sensor
VNTKVYLNMTNKSYQVEELLADETFLGWFFKSNDENVRKWEEWITANPHQQGTVDEAVELLKMAKFQEIHIPGDQMEEAEQRFIGSLNPNRRPEQSQVIPLPKRNNRTWLWIAASFAVLVVSTYFLVGTFNRSPTVSAPYGQIKKHQLPDGSEVVLNANSQLTIDKNWAKANERQVWIRGEAFFRVAKAADKKRFIVHTPHFDIVVTGTEFNVTARENISRVTLKEGSITVKNSGEADINLAPGEWVEIASNKSAVKNRVENENYVAWIEKILVFEDTPLKEVKKQLEEHYGISVRLADGIEDSVLNAIMQNDNLDVFIAALEATMEYTVQKNNDELIIRSTKR